MRKILMLMVVCGLVAGLANAREAKTVTGKNEVIGFAAVSPAHRPLNNVVAMDAAGNRTALCCCGAEFTVTDNAPVLDHDGTLFYMCGEGCKQMALKATPEESAKTLDAWWKKYAELKLTDNAAMKDGKTTATCVCGATFTVTDKTPYVMENGVTLYLCGDGCAEHFRSMAAADRLTAERKFLPPVPPPAAKGS
jgi:ribosomal protein L24E